MDMLYLFVLAVLVAFVRCDDDSPVTCGSMIKLKHKDSKHHLHSHQIAWGSGSGQQSITGQILNNDQGSNWLVKEAQGDTMCTIGTPIACGGRVRLEHIQSKKNLHSHLFRSALSGHQEVSGFGDSFGEGDTGDNWIVMCGGSKDDHWMRGSDVEFKHADTGKFLVTSNKFKFTQQNCGGSCPIMSQTEISASTRSKDSVWKTASGLYFPTKDEEHNNNEL